MHRANSNLSGLFRSKDLNIWIGWWTYTNLYSFVEQFTMNKKQKQGLVAKTFARAENKPVYFFCIFPMKNLIFLTCNEWYLISNQRCTCWHLLCNIEEDQEQRKGGACWCWMITCWQHDIAMLGEGKNCGPTTGAARPGLFSGLPKAATSMVKQCSLSFDCAQGLNKQLLVQQRLLREIGTNASMVLWDVIKSQTNKDL